MVLRRTPPALVAILLHRLFTILVRLRTCELCLLPGELATSRLLMSRLRLPLLRAASPLFLPVWCMITGFLSPLRLQVRTGRLRLSTMQPAMLMVKETECTLV